MEMFVGFVLCLVVEALLWGAYRMQQRMLPPRPAPQPLTPGQEANQAVFETEVAAQPRIARMKVQRRTRRGRHSTNVDDEYNPFE
jgi:hypothetical protein